MRIASRPVAVTASAFLLLAPDSDRESRCGGISARVRCRTLHSRATALEKATRTRSAGHRYSAVHSVSRRHSVNDTRLLFATRSTNSLVDCSAEHRRRQVEGKSWNDQCADPQISSGAARGAGSHVMLKHPAARSPDVYPFPPMIVKDRFAFSTASAGRKHSSVGLASTTSIAPFPVTVSVPSRRGERRHRCNWGNSCRR